MTGKFVVGIHLWIWMIIFPANVPVMVKAQSSINCGNASQAAKVFVVYKMFESYHFDQVIGDHEKRGWKLYDQIILSDQERNVTFYLNGVNSEEMASKIDELNIERYIDDRGKTSLIQAMKQGFYKSSYHTNFADGSIVHGLISAVQLPDQRYSIAGMLLKFKINDQKGFRKLTYEQLADLFNYAEYKSADHFRVKYKETLDKINDVYHICFG